MKTFKYILSVMLFVAAVISCTEEEFGSDDFVSTAVAPTNVSSLFEVTQDNTGTVTITPNSEGAVYYNLYLGDGTADPIRVEQGKNLTHVFPEGTYEIKSVAYGITGLITEATNQLVVSFKAPENLVVEILNDPVITKQVNVLANADHAASFDVYYGEEGNDEPVSANIGETASYVYQEPGTYTIRVVAMGAAIETTEYTEEFVVTEILQPLVSAPEPAIRNEADYISIYSDAYNNVADSDYNPDWGQSGQGSGYAEFDLDGDKMLNYINLSYQGIDLGSAQDASSMEMLHIDVWTASDMSIDIFPLPEGVVPEDERFVTKTLVANEWNSFDIPMSEFTDQGLPVDNLKQFKFTGAPWAEGTVFIDNLYFYKAPSGEPKGIVGTWKVVSEAGAIGVGPGKGDTSWWAIDAAGVADRGCYFDDTYVFGEDGSFSNVLGSETWVEGWQGGGDSCGTPIAPHDGSNAATFTHDEGAGTVTLNGVGAFLGIPKAINGAELSNPADAPASVTYEVTLSNYDTEMIVDIHVNGDGWWRYKLVKDGATPPSPLEGTWVVAPEAGSIGVGPGQGDISWWAIDAAGVAERGCFYDDTFVFGSDGTFSNVLGVDTWVEGWQGGGDACGAPVAPHDGLTPATYAYDSGAGTVTLNGLGAYLGIPKAVNGAELGNPADAPASVTYMVTLSSDSEMIVDIHVNGDGWWRYKLIKQGSSSGGGDTGGGDTGGGSTGDYDLSLPIDFETTGFGANWIWNVFENDTNPALEFVANPDASGINTSSTVAKITALQTGAQWVGTETAHGEMGITWDLSASNSIIKIMVYKTVISDVGIKLVNPANGAQVEIKVPNTLTNQWEELTFDFSGRIGDGLDGSTNIDQIVVFPDFTARTQDNVVYFDNITFQ